LERTHRPAQFLRREATRGKAQHVRHQIAKALKAAGMGNKETFNGRLFDLAAKL
jgi:hypothetical protein